MMLYGKTYVGDPYKRPYRPKSRRVGGRLRSKRERNVWRPPRLAIDPTKPAIWTVQRFTYTPKDGQ